MPATFDSKVRKVRYVPHVSDVDAFQEHFKSPPKSMKDFYVIRNKPSEKFKKDIDQTTVISPEQSTVNQAKSQLDDEKSRHAVRLDSGDSFSVKPSVIHTKSTTRKRKTSPTKNAGGSSKAVKKQKSKQSAKQPAKKKSKKL